MTDIILFDTDYWENLLPITYTRSIADIRLGIFKIKEKWERHTRASVYVETRDYLQPLYAEVTVKNRHYINSAVLPTHDVIDAISNLKDGESLYCDNIWIASYNIKPGDYSSKIELIKSIKLAILKYPEDLFIYAGQEIAADLKLIQKENIGKQLSPTNTVIGEHDVFISPEAIVECCIINASDGPVYVGSGAEIMEGCLIRGPFSLGDNSVLKMGARIYSNTSIGPWCKVGGEIKNSVILGYSNKAHDGYMGNSVIGEWCNWGADTNNSNMKNNYSEVKLWDYVEGKFRNTNEQFAGLIMGDHSKTGINTMFNTGTIVGVSCNIYGTGFPRKFIPSYSWGGVHGFKTYRIDKAIDTASAMQKRRDISFPQVEAEIMHHIYDESAKYRMWEK